MNFVEVLGSGGGRKKLYENKVKQHQNKNQVLTIDLVFVVDNKHAISSLALCPDCGPLINRDLIPTTKNSWSWKNINMYTAVIVTTQALL